MAASEWGKIDQNNASSTLEKQEIKNNKISTDTGTTRDTRSDETSSDPKIQTNTGEALTEEKNKSDKKLKQEINTYIIESYKAQGNKIIKDLSVKLTKSIPDEQDRKVAYEKIRTSLSMRIEQTQKDESISETKREILIEFLRHLIHLLGKKITELE